MHALEQEYNWKRIEQTVREYYKRINLNKFVYERMHGMEKIGFIEGPPTLNNQPHVGHVRGRIIKDLWYRLSTLEGKQVVFRGGWDTQGLPVELEAEKELGLTGSKKQNLLQIGEEKLVQECKRLIMKYRKYWEEADYLLGLFMDQENAYYTYRDEYIEREWRYLKEAWERGILGEGLKVVPYCPSCQTALSHAEINLGGYEKLKDPSMYYKVRLEDGSFLLVWTTMPFTVVTDEMVGVKPDEEYVYVQKDGELWILAEKRLEQFQEETGIKLGKVIKKVKGIELEGKKYSHPLIDLIPGLSELKQKIHFVVSEEFVDINTGSGIVHLAPANGEEDFEVARKRGLPLFVPFDEEVKFTKDAGVFSGIFARDADELVKKLLEERNSLVYYGEIVHDYPVCWRSGHRIVWLAKKEYFYWIDRIKEKLLSAAQKVEYYFDSPRNRFIEFIKESPPWCISRERVWGTPLPVWICSSCNEKIALFSRKEIVENAAELPDGENFELHRPWIDKVVIKCKKCGSKAYREPFVLDTWHNSGSAPYSSMDDKEYEEMVPVPFLTEGIDQTRGWAYTLLVLNVLMKNKDEAPYKSFLFQGHVLDEEGRKMSKSLGNVIWALDLLSNYSADVSRFYLMWKSSPEDSLTLDKREMSSRPYQILNTLYHTHLYFLQNSVLDGFKNEINTLDWAFSSGKVGQKEKWVLSKLSKLEEKVIKSYETMRINEACREIENFIINILSQGYIRMVRPELWKEEEENKVRRLAIYSVLHYVLERLDILLHPVSPFITEFLYQEAITDRSWEEPILLKGIRGRKFEFLREEGEVDISLRIEELTNAIRSKERIKRRWPLSELYVLYLGEGDVSIETELVESLCNVKKVYFSSFNEIPASILLRPNVQRISSIFKERTKQVLKGLRELSGSEAIETIRTKKSIKLEDGTEVPYSCYDVFIKAKEGYSALFSDDLVVVLNIQRNKELIAEGLMRDLARRIQSLRKEKGYPPYALISVAAVAGLEKEDVQILQPYVERLSFLVRAKKVEIHENKMDGNWKEEELDGKKIYLYVSM